MGRSEPPPLASHPLTESRLHTYHTHRCRLAVAWHGWSLPAGLLYGVRIKDILGVHPEEGRWW